MKMIKIHEKSKIIDKNAENINYFSFEFISEGKIIQVIENENSEMNLKTSSLEDLNKTNYYFNTINKKKYGKISTDYLSIFGESGSSIVFKFGDNYYVIGILMGNVKDKAHFSNLMSFLKKKVEFMKKKQNHVFLDENDFYY
jgi:hypothetical protein